MVLFSNQSGHADTYVSERRVLNLELSAPRHLSTLSAEGNKEESKSYFRGGKPVHIQPQIIRFPVSERLIRVQRQRRRRREIRSLQI